MTEDKSDWDDELEDDDEDDDAYDDDGYDEEESDPHGEMGPSYDDDFWDEFPEYRGEVRERKRWLAVLLTLLCPGLGYVYIGRFLTGMAINLGFLTTIFSFILSWRFLKFFPLWPGLILLVGWVGLVLMLALDVVERTYEEPQYVLKSTNHAMVYVAVAIFGFHLPLGLTLEAAVSHIWLRAWAGNDAMYPSVVEGDLILIDRTAYQVRSPVRGELVLVEEPSEGEVFFGRVIGVGGDRVHMEGSMPWVNSHQLKQYIHGTVKELDGHPQPGGLVELASDNPLMALIEAPPGAVKEGETFAEPKRWYLIAAPERPRIEPTEPVHLDKDELFILNDNRSMRYGPRFDRYGGRVVQLEHVVGKPHYVLFSVEPETERWRWERVGLRLQ